MKKQENYQPKAIPGEEQKALLSVVVAVYNIDRYIGKCVRSIMDQTYRNLEILLVDDGSNDNSPSICDHLAAADRRIRVIHKENGGLSDARNAGIEAARGEYITFVDGDDWIDAAMYESLLSSMQEFEAPLGICRYRQIGEHKTVDESTDSAFIFEGSEALESFIAEEDDIPIQNAAWNKLYTRELMGELRFPKGKYYEDIVYTTKLLARAHRVVFLDHAFYNYVLERNGSIMGEGIGMRIFTDQIPAYQEKETYLKQIKRYDLADQHRYFYYKRLLLYYTALGRSDQKGKSVYMKEIRKLIGRGREEMDRIYECPVANPNEKRKMDIFLCSPLLYRVAMWLNDRFVIPYKSAKRKKL